MSESQKVKFERDFRETIPPSTAIDVISISLDIASITLLESESSFINLRKYYVKVLFYMDEVLRV